MTDLSEKLNYGENPHQQAFLERDGSGKGIANARQIHGRTMSYNNYLDADAALQSVMEFGIEPPGVSIIKHTNPCGYATGLTAREGKVCSPMNDMSALAQTGLNTLLFIRKINRLRYPL